MKLIMMVGNIGTGKTTTAKSLFQIGESLYISNDGLCELLNCGRYNEKTWSDKHWPIYSDLKYLVATKALGNGFNIILDGTFISRDRRVAYIELAKKFGAKVEVHLHTIQHVPPNEIRTDGDHSGKKWEEIHANFADKYEEPSFDEGIDIIVEKT